MWINTKYTYKDTEGQKLTIETNEDDAVMLEAKDGVFFETEQEFLGFLDELRKKAESLFEEQ